MFSADHFQFILSLNMTHITSTYYLAAK